MKLKTYNPEVMPNKRTDKAIVGLNATSGTVRFNPSAVEKIGMKDNDEIVMVQDEEEPTDWYLEIVKNEGFKVRQKSTTGKNGLLMQSCGMVRKIFESVGFEGNSGNVLIGAEPVKFEKRTLWPIITANLVNS